jgi:hypothetical protein
MANQNPTSVKNTNTPTTPPNTTINTTPPTPNNTSTPKNITGTKINATRIAPNNTIKVANNTQPNNSSKPANNTQPNTIISNNKTVETNVSKSIKNILNAPKVNTVKKELGLNNLNTNKDKLPNGSGSGGENIKTTDQEMIEYGTVITNNYILLVCISAALVICIIVYYFSSYFRVGRAVDTMLRYQNFQRITSIEYKKFGSNRLGNMFVSSSYNSSHSGYQMYDYTSEQIVLSVLQSGARYIEFNVFNSEFGTNAYPVVSMGYKKGEWKMMITDTPLETIFDTIANNAFTISDGKYGVNNPEDPLFIGLNLNTNSNLSCLNLISMLILKYFKGRFLPSNYTFQNNGNLANIKLIELIGKVVFFSSDGYQGSGLEEIINGCWDNINDDPKHNIQRIHYSELTTPTFDAKKMIEYNKKGLTIVVPHMEGDFLNTNYDTIPAFETGCQFVSMEFQYINNYMDSYITRFKEKSLISKNKDLQ